MKKMVFGFTVLMSVLAAMATSVSGINNVCTGHTCLSVSSQLTTEGTHCRGTVGCNCPGFAPITDGDLWQQAYCKHCGHKRGFHN